MALLQVNLFSNTLMRSVPIAVILPIDKILQPDFTIGEEKPFKTLYLLHGVLGNYMDWITGTRIERWANEKNLAVVMPSGDNSFYVDNIAARNCYGEFIGNELVSITRKMFPLSKNREDTFIAGLSMGGYGAIRNGLKYHETFSHIAGLSSALNLEDTLQYSYDEPLFINNKAYYEACFGNLEDALRSDSNPKVLVKQLCEKSKKDHLTKIPNIYLACGTEDEARIENIEFRDYLIQNGAEVTYVEGPGNHDWDFWDRYIKKVLEWLPL